MRPETIKPLGEIMGSKLLDVSLGDEFLEVTSKARATKAKISGTMSNKKLCTAKETINKMKR